VYQVGINKGIILRCTAYQISRFAGIYFFKGCGFFAIMCIHCTSDSNFKVMQRNVMKFSGIFGAPSICHFGILHSYFI